MDIKIIALCIVLVICLSLNATIYVNTKSISSGIYQSILKTWLRIPFAFFTIVMVVSIFLGVSYVYTLIWIIFMQCVDMVLLLKDLRKQ